jgi:hypothetical protein
MRMRVCARGGHGELSCLAEEKALVAASSTRASALIVTGFTALQTPAKVPT